MISAAHPSSVAVPSSWGTSSDWHPRYKMLLPSSRGEIKIAKYQDIMTPYIAPRTQNHGMVSNQLDAIRNTKKIYGLHRRIKANLPVARKHAPPCCRGWRPLPSCDDPQCSGADITEITRRRTRSRPWLLMAGSRLNMKMSSKNSSYWNRDSHYKEDGRETVLSL